MASRLLTFLRGHRLAVQASVSSAGTPQAAVVGYASIAWLLDMLKRNTTLLFIIYRIALGLLILGLLYAGTLQP